MVGERGELVCTKPFPSMPVHFLNDPEGKKYKAAYFDKFPGDDYDDDDVDYYDDEVKCYCKGNDDLNPGDCCNRWQQLIILVNNNNNNNNDNN